MVDELVGPAPFVSLSLDCIDSRKENTNCGDMKVITNTIKSANLPIYTVKRVGPKDKPVIVTLTWTATGDSGSVRQTAYDPTPRIVPFLNELKNTQKSETIEDNEKGTCNENQGIRMTIGKFLNATFYSFKFIGLDDEALTTVKPSGTNMMGTLSVTIPAGSRTATFRLDPHRCPDSTTFFKTSDPQRLQPESDSHFAERVKSTGSNTVSINIKSISDESGFDDMLSSKALTIQYPLNSKPTANIETTFTTYADTTGLLNVDVPEDLKKLNKAVKEADKVAGTYGTSN